jgi:uncharacterized protein (TIGR02271 family)
MIDREQLADLVDAKVVDAEGRKVGKVGQLYLDDLTGEPEWVTVSPGLLGGLGGSKDVYVPITDATLVDGELRLPFSKDLVSAAPSVDVDRHLAAEDEERLHRHYSQAYAEDAPAAGAAPATPPPAADDDAMTRSEEQLRVTGTQRRTAGTARLRKWVETDVETVEVPVRREKARLEVEPSADAGGAVGGAATGTADVAGAPSDDATMVLHEERPVVTTETVPVEQVRLTTEQVQDTETVTEEVRKEQVALEVERGEGGR